MKKPRRSVSGLVLVLCAAILTNGCSAVKVSSRAPKKNMNVLNPGTARSQVVSELGSPILSRDKEGEKVDTFAFDPGLGGGAKFGRALFHVAADLVTICLWELVAWPTESMAASGAKKTKVDVTYDKEENVKFATYLK